MTRIHVLMLVRNEAHRYLEKALRCAYEIAQMSGGSIIVTDDASQDETFEICKRWTHRVQTTDEPLFWQHEGQARQRHLDYASQFMNPGDWVLSLDADETINDPLKLVSAAGHAAMQRHVAVGLPLYEFWSSTQYRTDGMWHGTFATRLFAWQEGGRIADKQMASGSEPLYVQEAVAKRRWYQQTSAHLLHWGYLRQADRERKYLLYSQRSGGHGHNSRHVQSIVSLTPELAVYPDLDALL